MSRPTIVIAPDSFKGSICAPAAARALASGLHSSCPQARLIQAPMADGGEGTLDCITAAIPGRWHTCRVEAIHGAPVTARWYETADHLAVIESATILGLPLIQASTDAPCLHERSSHALGVMLGAALDAGARRFLIGLGGSACNDAGLGLLTALGCVARDHDGGTVPPGMNGLVALDRIGCETLDPRLARADIRVLCDVDNPLLGTRGASRVYGPQKGLADCDIGAVDTACDRLAGCMHQRHLAHAPGSGAAGGLGFALATIGGQLLPGAETLIDLTGLHARLAAADLVITGEGRSDAQTLAGKLPVALARAAGPAACVLVSGAIDTGAKPDLEQYFSACHALTDLAGSRVSARARPAHWLRAVGRIIGRDLRHL